MRPSFEFKRPLSVSRLLTIEGVSTDNHSVCPVRLSDGFPKTVIRGLKWSLFRPFCLSCQACDVTMWKEDRICWVRRYRLLFLAATDGVPAKYNHLICTEPWSHNSSVWRNIVATLRKLMLCGKFRQETGATKSQINFLCSQLIVSLLYTIPHYMFRLYSHLQVYHVYKNGKIIIKT
jgi:hypothetical protein